MKKAKHMQKQYDLTAEIYDARYSEVQREKYEQALAGIELRGRILDLGSGTGLLREFLKIDVIGADISMNMLVKGAGGRVQAEAEKLPFKSNSFDYVLSFSTLQNIENPEVTLKEAKRVLAKDGIFICTYLKSFKFDKIISKHFKILKKRNCGEDTCLVLKS